MRKYKVDKIEARYELISFLWMLVFVVCVVVLVLT